MAAVLWRLCFQEALSEGGMIIEYPTILDGCCNEGAEAAKQGKRIYENPYGLNSLMQNRGYAWLAGYLSQRVLMLGKTVEELILDIYP